MAHQPGASFAGRYTLERVLGRGATASVWLAHDAVTAERVALKILREELSGSADRDHFLREIRRMAGFSHPRILAVLDAGEDSGALYFALPYMSDGTLRDRLEREGQLPVPDVLRVSRALADALGYAHAHGFVHRDVKPENILFRDGEAHLTDFGICRALERTLDESSTSRGLVRGTPAYMSPEQASGERDYDGRSDLFSLGCVMYEMLAGVPAFIGPSAQIQIAQRFLHAPHALAVYRPAVPAALDAAISKCLQIVPADRYRDAGALAAALAAIDPDEAPAVSSGMVPAATPGTTRRVSRRVSRRMSRRMLLPLAAAGVAITAAGWGVSQWRDAHAGPVVVPDTTLIALFPFERADGSRPTSIAMDDDLLRDALSRWEGVSLVSHFQIRDAVRRVDGMLTVEEASGVASRLGAGRFVRAELSGSGNERIARLAVYEVGESRALHEARLVIPDDRAAAAETYQRLAWSLLLRDEVPDEAELRTAPVRSLAAAQAFSQARLALDEWDLARADTLFQLALEHDRDDAQSQYWLAQVRSWRGRDVDTWASFAERASRADSMSFLPEREQRLAIALAALADSRYANACAIYDSLRQRNPRDFAALYGLGQCHSMDHVVVRDERASESGWRFRSSQHAALNAYEAAFAVLPTVHRGYEGSAFDGLQQLLLVTSWVVDGISLPDSARFQARPSWRGDTLALIPVPWEIAVASGSASVPEGFSEALVRQRRSFHRIAAGWSSAFPRSSEAKEAVAIALELLQNAAAIDTVRAAQRLAASAQRRLDLGAAEVRLLLRFGLPDDTARLREARSLADSILRVSPVRASRDAQRLSVLAALVGDCDTTERLMGALIPSTGYFGIPSDMLVESQHLLARAALRCEAAGGGAAFRALAAQITDATRGAGAGDARLFDDVLLLRPLLMSATPDSILLRRLTSPGGPAVAQASFAAAVGDLKGIARHLRKDSPNPANPPRTPDFAWIGTRLWMQVADTLHALEWADEALGNVRTFDSHVLGDAASVAALVNLMEWRGDIAAALGDHVAARRWQAAVRSIRDPS